MLSTLGPLGYLPGSGTVASVVTLLLVYIIAIAHFSLFVQSMLVLLLCGVSLMLIDKALSVCTSRDPSEIVLDEVMGMLVTFIGIPVTPVAMGIGFILFRLFDITKWCGLRRLQLLPGAWGVLIDDLAAGLISNLLLQTVMRML